MLLNQPGTQDLRTKLLMQARQFYVDFLYKYDGAQLDDQLRRELARTHYNLGEITRATAGDSESLTFYETARDMQLQLRSRNQKDADLLYDLGNTFNALGRTHDNLGERNEALNAYEQSFEVRRQLADSHPNNSEYQRKLASTIMNIGLVKRDDGLEAKDLATCDVAKKHIDRAQKLRLHQVEKLEQELIDGVGEEVEATLSRMRQDLARGFFNLAVFEEEMFWEGLTANENQAFAEAADLYQKAIDSLEPLSASGDMEISFLLGEYYRHLGNAVADVKQTEIHYQAAKQRLEQLAYFNPKVKKYQAALARLHRSLGVLYLDLAGDGESPESTEYRDQARSAFEKAIEIFEPWKDDDEQIRTDWEDSVKRLNELGPAHPEPM